MGNDSDEEGAESGRGESDVFGTGFLTDVKLSITSVHEMLHDHDEMPQEIR